jgi:hypothetical protein
VNDPHYLNRTEPTILSVDFCTYFINENNLIPWDEAPDNRRHYEPIEDEV